MSECLLAPGGSLWGLRVSLPESLAVLGKFLGILERPRECLKTPWKVLRGSWGVPGDSLVVLGGSLGGTGKTLGEILGSPQKPLGSLWEVLGSPLEVLGNLWAVIGSPWGGNPWPKTDDPGGFLGRPGTPLEVLGGP
jgi:hypothetical protein